MAHAFWFTEQVIHKMELGTASQRNNIISQNFPKKKRGKGSFT